MSDDSKFGKYCPAEDGDLETTAVNRDPVGHYIRGGVECIDVMRAISTPEGFQEHCRLTAFKYLYRLGEKDSAVNEAKKAMDYATWLYESLKGEGE